MDITEKIIKVTATETELMSALEIIANDINKRNHFKNKYGMSFSSVRDSILGGFIKPTVATFITNLAK
jgi:hypothetical protein